MDTYAPQFAAPRADFFVSDQPGLTAALTSSESNINIIIAGNFSISPVVAITGTNKTITMTSDAGGPYTILRNVTGSLFTLSGTGTTVTLTNITIDGNKTTTAFASNSAGPLFNVTAAAQGDAPNLIIGDGATLQNNRSTANTHGAAVTATGGGFVRLDSGGRITANAGSTDGAVYLSGSSASVVSKMLIDGGSVDNNTGSTAAGIYVNTFAQLQITSGNISYNIGTNGGVYLTSASALMLMDGGSVDHNATTTNGIGGIYLTSNAQLYMTAGSIAYNAGQNGGGVYVNSDATFTMDGGYVEYNTTTGSGAVHGGGIDLSAKGAKFIMNGGYIQYNSSPYGGGISIHASVAATIQMNAGNIIGNEAAAAGAVGAGILFYNGAENVQANVYIGVTPGGSPTAGPVNIINNQALLGTAGGIGATLSAGTGGAPANLPTATQLLTKYWTHLFVGPNVVFSGNQSSKGRDVSGNACTEESCTADVDSSVELLCQQFRTLSASHIETTTFTAPFTYGYNDFDIQMPIGCSVAAIIVTFRPSNGQPETSYIVPAGGTVPNPTPVEGCDRSYTFWYTDAAYTIPYDFNTEIWSAMVLYGQDRFVSCNEHKVTFNSNGGTPVPMQIVETGESAIAPKPPPTRKCDIFDGWFTDTELLDPFIFGISTVDDDMVLYAKWTDNACIFDVTFDSDGGTPVATEHIEEGGTAAEPPTPTRNCDKFDGWYSDAALTTPFDFSTTPILENRTLYAKWIYVATGTVHRRYPISPAAARTEVHRAGHRGTAHARHGTRS